MTTAIIDAEGRLWDSSSSLLRSKLCCPLAGSELADFAVKNMGLVMLRRRGPRSVEVRHRPSLVKPVALLGAVQWLTDHAWDRIVLTSWLGQWKTSLIGDPARAVQHLMSLVADAQGTRQRDFQARRHAQGGIAADPAFARIQDAWQMARGVKDQRLVEALAELSCNRVLEVIPQNGASRLVIGAIGNGYSLFGRGWKLVSVGGRFEDAPDYEYGQWAAQGYREAFRARQPIFEDITAVIRLPRAGRLHLAYRRVILPIGAGGLANVLLGASLNQRVTHLGLESPNEFGDVVQ